MANVLKLISGSSQYLHYVNTGLLHSLYITTIEEKYSASPIAVLMALQSAAVSMALQSMAIEDVCTALVSCTVCKTERCMNNC
jgi:hypothetical protein